jgi:hypothetical protein
MSGPIIWGGSNNVGLLLPAVPSAGALTTDISGNLGVSQLIPGSFNYAQAYFSNPSIWSTTSSTFTDPTNTGGNTLTIRKSNGIGLTAAASNVCGITFTPASNTAVYQVTATIATLTQTTSSATGNAQLTDGTTVIAAGAEVYSGSGSIICPTTLTGIYAPGTTNAVTLKIQLAVSGGNVEINQSNTTGASVVEWTVVRIDSLIPGTAGVTPGVLNYYNGYFNTSSSNYWSTTSTTYANPSLTGSVSLTTRKNNSMTVTAAAGNLPGFTFTPPSTNAVYYVNVTIPTFQVGNNTAYYAQLWDGTTQIASGATYSGASASSAGNSVSLQGIYAPATTSAVTLSVQLAVSSGTGYIGNYNSLPTMDISIVRLDTLTSQSGINRSVNVISSPTTAGATASTDYVYLVSGTTTLTLPTAVGNTNRYTVKNTGVNTVSIATTSAQTIDGSSSPTTLPVANTSLDLISDGANWRII